jgi:hypothetical protein
MAFVSLIGMFASPSIVGMRVASPRSATEVPASGRPWHAMPIHRDPGSGTAIAERQCRPRDPNPSPTRMSGERYGVNPRRASAVGFNAG